MNTDVSKKQIGQLLLNKGLITKEQLDEALEIQAKGGDLLGKIFVKLGYITEEDLVSTLALQYGFPYLPLSNYDIDPEVVKLIPEDFSIKHYVIPIDKIGKILTIVMADPLDTCVIEDIERMTNCRIQIFVCATTDIINALNQIYPTGKAAKMPDEYLSSITFKTPLKDKKQDKKNGAAS